jgi:hypothetical protein
MFSRASGRPRAFAFPPRGVIFGHVAVRQIKRSGQEGYGLAVAGLVCGYSMTAVNHRCNRVPDLRGVRQVHGLASDLAMDAIETQRVIESMPSNASAQSKNHSSTSGSRPCRKRFADYPARQTRRACADSWSKPRLANPRPVSHIRWMSAARTRSTRRVRCLRIGGQHLNTHVSGSGPWWLAV